MKPVEKPDHKLRMTRKKILNKIAASFILFCPVLSE